MSDNILTAERIVDLIIGIHEGRYVQLKPLEDYVKDYTIGHVNKALISASNRAKTKFIDGSNLSKTPTMWDITIDKESILNAYPSTNIK